MNNEFTLTLNPASLFFSFGSVRTRAKNFVKLRKVLVLTVFSLAAIVTFQKDSQAATFWTGPKITFTKANLADWTLAANQDRITNSVWLTRQNAQGLLNIAPGKETAFQSGISPLNTEWALGTIAGGLQTLVFDDWQTTIASNPPGSIGKNMVLHLITEDIYIDIKFLSWQGGREGFGGGGFSYERSTAAAPTAASVPAFSAIAEAGLAFLLALIILIRLRVFTG